MTLVWNLCHPPPSSELRKSDPWQLFEQGIQREREEERAACTEDGGFGEGEGDLIGCIKKVASSKTKAEYCKIVKLVW